MGDEELVQCPINPDHRVPISQIVLHVKICQYMTRPNDRPDTATSSRCEPRPSTSSQEPLDSHGASTLNDPFQSFRNWRSPQKPPESWTKFPDIANKPGPSETDNEAFKNNGTETTEVENDIRLRTSSWDSNRRRFLLEELRLYNYYLDDQVKIFNRLRIRESSDSNSSSDNGSPKLTATVQQKSSTKPDVQKKRKHEQIDTEEIMEDETLHLSTQETTLEVELIEPSSSGYVSKEQSKRVIFQRKKIHDLDSSQQASSSKRKKFEQISIEMIGIPQQAGSSQQASSSQQSGSLRIRKRSKSISEIDEIQHKKKKEIKKREY